ncbi:MAG: class A beta-lactamase [Bacteroidota bacterium]
MKSITIVLFLFMFISCSNENGLEGLREEIDKIILDKNATFGIGIYDFKNDDTLFINKDKQFAMMSVVKFPQAVAILDQVDKGKLDYDMNIHFENSDLRQNTYSPLRNQTTGIDTNITLVEGLSYTVSKSDNNVYDKFFKILRDTEVVEKYLQNLGLNNTTVGTDYANMEVNTIYANKSTPKDMLELLRMLHDNEILSKKSNEVLWQKMVETFTGPDRIKGLLPEGTIVAHKTGTSGKDENGVTAAYNDVGIVNLPNGTIFAIVVFIADSKEKSNINARAIAEISKAVYDYLNY